MGINNKVAIDARRWPGVLAYRSKKRKVRGKYDVCYYIRYTLTDGRKKTEKIGWKSEGYNPPIAAEIRSERLRKVRHGEVVKTAREIAREKALKDRTLNEIKEKYFNSDRGMHLKGKNTDENRYDLHLKPILSKRCISSLSPLDVERIKKNMKSKAPATICNTLELLRRLINFGTRNNLCPPLNFTIQLPQKNNEVIEYLDNENFIKLRETILSWKKDRRKRPDAPRMLELAMATGMRRGEIFKLEECDLKFNEEIILIRDPKGRRDISIPMNSLARAILLEQLSWKKTIYPNSSYVFPGQKGGRRVDCSAVDRIKVKAGIPKEFRIFHGLRHHFAVTLANSGDFSLDMIGDLLTQKNAIVTKRYAQFLPGTKRTASEKAANLIRQQMVSSVKNMDKENAKSEG
jgi:integrase